MTITRVYLVRHGETDANRNGIIQGHLDTPLNEPGTEQARLVGKALSAIQFNEAYSSDLSRAVQVCLFPVSRCAVRSREQTADAILEHHTTVELCKQKELRERVRLSEIDDCVLTGQNSTWVSSKANYYCQAQDW